MQYCSLQHQTLLRSAVTSTTGFFFFFALASCLHSGVISPLISAYWAPTDLRSSSFRIWNSATGIPSPPLALFVGSWNVRSMNQGKLEVVKQEMARVNVDILGISELKWTEMGEFNSDDHYIYYCGQESLRRNGIAIMVNKRVRYLLCRYGIYLTLFIKIVDTLMFFLILRVYFIYVQ